MRKRIAGLLLAGALLCSVALTAYAHEVPQEREDCSIRVALRYDGIDIDGGTLTAIRVGYVAEEDGDYFFRREMDHVRLEDTQSPEAAGELLAFYEENRSDFSFFRKTVKVERGEAAFTGLVTGLYLIVQEEAAEGYSKLSPFLVGIPYLENGEYQCQVTAASKLEREPEPTTTAPTKPTGPNLPQTGQLNWPVPVLTVSGLGLFAVGWLLRRKEGPYGK